MKVSDLRNNINKIESSFLPQQNPIGGYSEKEALGINAYISLVHSEIENFIEAEVLQVCNLSVNQYETNGTINKVILGLLCFSGLTYEIPPESKHIQNIDKLSIENKIKKARDLFNNIVRTKNNGIKEKNILSMLLPIGYSIDEIDDLFLTEMNDFGRQRGEIAHTSNIAIVTKNQIDPYVIKGRITSIVEQLEIIETNICSYIAPLELI